VVKLKIADDVEMNPLLTYRRLFMTEQRRLCDLMLEFEAALRKQGFSISTVLHSLCNLHALRRLHDESGEVYLNNRIISEYMTSLRKRYDDGEISTMYFRAMMRDMTRFLEFFQTGTITQLPSQKGSTYTLTPEFSKIADSYLTSDEFHPNTRNDMRWVTHKYFAWLIAQGHKDLSKVGAQQLQKFLVDCAKQMSVGSMHDIKIHLKKLYSYLYNVKLSTTTFKDLLSFPINRESKFLSCLSQDEIAKILNGINRNTPKGKRAYAIMTLGADLGIRACDVIALKLTDIDWINGEIRIIQTKTSGTVVLPLTERVFEALQDYILNVRHGDSKHVFESLKVPYTQLISAVTVGEVYKDCCAAVGIDDKKRFHTLRRSLGTAMVSNGVSVLTAAQVFGDARVNSMKKYIASDTVHLKMCALPLDGIAPKGGGTV
jgi:site-specific recombinase XerD